MSYEKSLQGVLDLVHLGEDEYQGTSMDLGFGRLFGGQVLAQAFLAVSKTVDKERSCHSLHSYFLRMGRADQPVKYVVERVRDGRSFSNRRVQAWQNERCLFVMSVSFQVPEDDVFRCAPIRAGIKYPEDLLLDAEWLEKNKEKISDRVLRFWTQPSVFEQKSEELLPFIENKQSSPIWTTWFRLKEEQNLLRSDDVFMQQALFLWYSDMMVLVPALKPHGVTYGRAPFKMASLDHSVWFHEGFSLEDWQLYDLESTYQGGGRTLCGGKVYSSEGRLLITVTQEALMRRVEQE